MNAFRAFGVTAAMLLAAAAGCEEGKRYVPKDAGPGGVSGGLPDAATGDGSSTDRGGAGQPGIGSGGSPASGGDAGGGRPGTASGGTTGGMASGGSGGNNASGTGGVPPGTGGVTAGTGGVGGEGLGTGGTSVGGRAGIGTGGAGMGGAGLAGTGGRGTGGAATGGAGSGGSGGSGGPTACQTGQTKCSGTDLQTCASDGAWGNTMSCGAHRACTGPSGTAKCTCTTDPVCSAVGNACSTGNASVVMCQMDGNGCLFQASSTTCTNGACSAGACCTNACTVGVMECANGGIRSCQKGSNGCGAWTMTSTCTTPLVCERYSGPTCADANWAEWPMPNSPSDAGTPNQQSYTNNGDGTVTDNVSKLMWQQAVSTTTYSWDDARSYCSGQVIGGFKDWRVPSLVELVSIMDLSLSPPFINGVFFPSTPSDYLYWTNTQSSYGDTAGWSIDFGTTYEYPMQGDYKIRTNYVRCVR